MGKHETEYYQCPCCGFVQTGPPHWLGEAYSRVINRSDVGQVDRNLKQARLTFSLIKILFPAHGDFLDYGGGYGLLVRLMRDRGMRFHRYDPLCENLFAWPFDVDLQSKRPFDLVTAFEVFEHLTQPLDEIQKMLQFAPAIFFSTLLLPATRPKPQEWWYYGLDHGQHVSIFTLRSLEVLGETLGLQVCSNGHSYHLLSRSAVSKRRFRLAMSDRFSRLVEKFVRQPSLIAEDYFHVTGQRLG